MSMEHIIRVLRHSKSEHGARLVMVVLANYANDRDEAYPSVPTIADRANLTDRSVQNALKKLLEDGELKLLDGLSRYETRRYLLVDPRRGEESAPGEESDHTGVKNETSQTSPDPTPLFNPTTDPTPTPLTDLDIVWAHYQEHIPGAKRQKLESKRRTIIKNALAVRSAEECCRAIDGLAASDFHNGKNDRRRPYLGLQYALKGIGAESDDERIDKMGSNAPQRAGTHQTPAEVLARLSPGAREAVGERMRQIRQMKEFPLDEPHQQRGREALAWMRSQLHLSPVLDAAGDVTAWERVAG